MTSHLCRWFVKTCVILIDIAAQINDTSLDSPPHNPLDHPVKFTVVRTDNRRLLREEQGATVTAAWFVASMFGHLREFVPDDVQQFLTRLEAGRWAQLPSFPAPDKAIHALTIRD